MSNFSPGYIDSLPVNEGHKRRIKITVGCKDTVSLPRVEGAGEIFDGPGGRFQLMHNGLRVVEDGYIGRWVTEIIRIFEGFHEPQEEKAFAEILRYIPENGVMIELGSWWSYYSLWFQKEVAHARNYMIEPDINNLEVGRRNFALNDMKGHHFNAAVGKVSIESILYRCYESDNVERPVEVVSMDDFVMREGIKYVDLLLADIQGFELDMLEGARRTIENRKIRFLVLSTHHHSISNDPLMHQKCLAFLQDHGAHILVEHTIAELYSGDGLIVASLRPQDRNLPQIQVSRNLPRNSLFRETEYDLADAWTERSNFELIILTQQTEYERLNDALRVSDVARQKSDGQLNALEAECQRLDGQLNALEAERQRLDTTLGIVESERQRLDATLKTVSRENLLLENALETMRNEQVEMQNCAQALESEVTALRSESNHWWAEADRWWRAADHYRTTLEEVYTSYSWKLTAPMRTLHIRENVKRLILTMFLLVRKIPGAGKILNVLHRVFPRLWSALAVRVLGPGPTINQAQDFISEEKPTENALPVEPSTLTSAQLSVVALAALEDEQHFLDLFEQELSQRQTGKTEMRS